MTGSGTIAEFALTNAAAAGTVNNQNPKPASHPKNRAHPLLMPDLDGLVRDAVLGLVEKPVERGGVGLGGCCVPLVVPCAPVLLFGRVDALRACEGAEGLPAGRGWAFGGLPGAVVLAAFGVGGLG